MSEERFGPKLTMFVCYCSGEDANFPVTELTRHTRRTNGWQSPKLCEYPQELGFRFEGEVELQNLRVLVHESKIPSRIEIFVAEASEEDRLQGASASTYDRAVFRRLGHVNFCSNEENNFEARELKTVSIRRTCVFLKLIIRKPHVNDVNVFGQVGIVAVSPHGHVLRMFRPPQGMAQYPDIAVGEHEDVPLDEMTPDARDAAIQEDEAAAAQSAPEGCEGLDAQTIKKVRELLLHKTRAAQEEDYDLAKALKQQIDALKAAGSQIAELEAQKKKAVEDEDYDTAKQLKQRIDELRVQAQPRSAALQPAAYNFTAPPPQFNYTAPPPVPASATAQWSMPAQDAGPEPHQVAEQSPPRRWQPAPKQSATQSSFDERPAVGAGKLANPTNIDQIIADDDTGGIVTKNRQVAAAGPSAEHPTSGNGMAEWEERLNRIIVRNSDDQPKAEVLTGAKAQDAKSFQTEFGGYAAACLFSKRWQLREAAVRSIASPEGFQLVPNKAGAAEAILQYAAMKAFGINDSLAAVFFVVCDSVQALLRGDLRGAPGASSLANGFSNILGDLLLKAGDNNARVREVAATTLTMIAGSDVGSERVAAAALAEPENATKKPLNHRVHIARIHVVTLLLQEVGLNRKDCRTGLTPDSIMTKLVVPSLAHSHQDVREGAMALLVDLYRVAPSVKKYIDELKSAQRLLIEERIQQAGGQPVDTSPQSKGKAQVTKRDEPEMVSSSFSVEKGGSNPVLNAARQVRDDGAAAKKPAGKPAAAKPAPPPVEDKSTKTCQFCDRYDKRFNEHAFHIHYLRTCPMLCPCPLCTQVTEISNLQNHIVSECEHKALVKQCPICKEAVRAEDLDDHVEAKACIPASSKYSVCPLCHAKLSPPNDEGWKRHLLHAPGCENNPRSFDGGNGEEFA